MKQAGRKSAAALALTGFRGEPARLKPSPGLTEPEGKLFPDLVLAGSPGHFQEVDRPLIDAYVRALVRDREHDQAIAAVPTMPRPGWSRRRRKPFAWCTASRCAPLFAASSCRHINPASGCRVLPQLYDRAALEGDDWNPP